MFFSSHGVLYRSSRSFVYRQIIHIAVKRHLSQSSIYHKMSLPPPPPADQVVKKPVQPKWWKEATVYQVYPASFKDSNGDGLGDIPGITSELDYIKNLGVDIVWSSPLLASPQVDMGYDISDYKDIHPPYGTMADHDALIKGLHDRGMKYVLDLVVNHTSDEHEWFKQSRSSKDNPYRDWYYWKPARYNDQGERIPPNNWEAAFSGSVWTWDETTQEYYLHLFASAQPDLNWENPKVVEAVHDIIRFWLDRGVDGFRMDVINFISKTPGLPDAKITQPGFLQHGTEHFACGPRLHEFLHGMGQILQEYDAFSVGEMPGVTDPKEIAKGVGQDRGELGMAFQFEIVNMQSDGAKWEHRDFHPKELKSIVNKWQTFMLENAGWNALYMENHDQSRVTSRYCSDADHLRTISSKMIASHLALQSGTVYVYQGQELAQKNVPRSWGIEKYRDIEALNHWKTVLERYPNDKAKQQSYLDQYWLIGRDNARTPMQWSSARHAGFIPSSASDSIKPWMDIHEDYETWNAASAVADPNSAYHYWRHLLDLKKQNKEIFVYGDFKMLDMEHEWVISYVRTADPDLVLSDSSSLTNETKKSKALIITNFAGEDQGPELWWKIPAGYEEFFVSKDNEQKEENVISSLRNYTQTIEVKTEKEGVWLKLRPYEVIVALI